MPMKELEALLSMVNADDQAALEAIVAKNPILKGFAEVAEGAIAGDDAKMGEGFDKMKSFKPTTTAASNPANDLAALEAAIDKRFSPEYFDSAAEKALDRIAKNPKSVLGVLGDELVTRSITRSLRAADELGVIRETHRDEFGKRFDFNAFESWYDAEAKKGSNFPSITSAYDHYVMEDRVQARIKKGIEDGTKNAANNSVPGSSMTAGQTISPQSNLGKLIQLGSKDEAKTASHDAAIAALAALRNKQYA